MSLSEGLASLLRQMETIELTLAFLAVLGYCVAINGSYSGNLRSGAASIAFAAATGFTTLTPSWISAIVFLALVVAGIAAFVALAWALSSLLGLGEVRATVPALDYAYLGPTEPRGMLGMTPQAAGHTI